VGEVCCTLVVPCYNESRRFQAESFAELLETEPRVRLLFANDGSSDGTLAMLQAFCAQFPEKTAVLDIQPNGGKGEAVRRGMLHAMNAFSGKYVGFWDADLATPLAAIRGFLKILESTPEIEFVFGARVRLLGRHVHRNPARHYIGRVFATIVSLSLGLAIYDTQCGAKLFRADDALRKVLQTPFESRWIFDVELLARYIADWRAAGINPDEKIYELPLKTWVDVPGSKVRPKDFVRSFVDLVKIRKAFTARREDTQNS
jgi:glycosyltransferase involved in cell wall biosynthesis